MSDFDPELVAEFILDAQEMLERVERGLLDLEQGAPFSECYRNIFSGLHNIKGAAAMFGFPNLEKLTHGLEDQVQESQSTGAFATEVVEALFIGIDQMRKLLVNRDQGPITSQPTKESHEKPTVPSPAPPISMAREDGTKKARPSWNGIRVLVVDDDPEVLDLLARFLNRDFLVSLASSFEEALAKMQTESIDCVVCDINMPLRNGIELLREIRKKEPETPVLMISAQAEKENLIQIIQNKAFTFLEKPFTQGQLLKATREALRDRAKSIMTREKSKILNDRVFKVA